MLRAGVFQSTTTLMLVLVTPVQSRRRCRPGFSTA